MLRTDNEPRVAERAGGESSAQPKLEHSIDSAMTMDSGDDADPEMVDDEVDLTVTVLEEEQYVPRVCDIWWLAPVMCLFKARGGKESVPRLSDGQWATLILCCICGFLNAYDWELWPLTLSQFQREMNVSETDISLIGSAIRLGNALSFPVSALGDWYGRKFTMIISSMGYVALMTGTGLSTSSSMFTFFQVVARGFMAAQTTLSSTMIVEALSKESRGWGVGLFSAIGVLGSALSLILFGIVGDNDGAWRWMYGVSVVLFLPLFCFMRRVPESKRFLKRMEDKRDRVVDESKYTKEDLQATRRIYISRTLWSILVNALMGFSFAPSETFKIKKLIELHGLGAGAVSIVQILTGWIAFGSFTMAGSLSDVIGRKRFLGWFTILCSVGAIVFFSATEAQPALALLANFINILAGFVLSTLKQTYFAELFPTSRRSSAQGLFVVCDVLAGALSLLIESSLYVSMGSHWPACAVLASPAILAGFIILAFLPEVKDKDLEHLAPEVFTKELRPPKISMRAVFNGWGIGHGADAVIEGTEMSGIDSGQRLVPSSRGL